MKSLLPFTLIATLLLVAGCASHSGSTASPPHHEVGSTEMPAITSLHDSTWALIRLQGEAVVVPPDSRRPFISFNADGRLHGFSGINLLNGSPQVDGHAIDFGLVAATLMAGPTEAMKTESRLFECFRLAQSWRITQGQLELMNKGTVLAVFKPVALADTE